MNSELVDIADLDCIYLSYDEPKKEAFWIKIQNQIPWAKHVSGIKGSDAAHKAAADASETDRFILIDGDNLPDSTFFNLQLELNDRNRDCVFRWKAQNIINGLQYGNGGMSCWTKDFVYNMRTHELSDGSDDTCVEFCFDPNYWAMHDCYSITYPNQSPFQAWRAGFREGVKMCLDRGAKPTLQDFKTRVHSRNYNHLSIWHNIGLDVDNGNWAIIGARLGTYLTMLSDWDYRTVQDFDELEKLWKEYQSDYQYTEAYVNDVLQVKLGLPIVQYNADQSSFFKHHYKENFINKGPMIRE
jgi:hypothetical protein